MSRCFVKISQFSKLLHAGANFSRIHSKTFAGVSQHSWAAEFIVQKGEKLVPQPPKDSVHVTLDVLNSPPEKVKKLIDECVKLNVMECHLLFKLIQTRLGLSDEYMEQLSYGSLSASGASAAGAAKAAPVEEKVKEIFDVKLLAVDAKAKIKVIKEVRTITGLGLKEAKELVEKAPVVLKAGVKTDELEQIKKLIVEAGGAIEAV